MEGFIKLQTVEELKTAYTEMLEGCLKHPEHWKWYAIWMIVVHWALQQSGVTRVEAEAEFDHKAAQRVLEKCGFIATGIIGTEGPRFVWSRNSNELLMHLDQLHTTELGVLCIRRNLSLDTNDVVGWYYSS